MINYSIEKPEEVVIGNHLGQKQRTVNFNIVETEFEGYTQYTFNTVTLPPGFWTYEAIVSALVNEIYPSDKMQAVLNNYLLDPVEFKEEMNEMQEWRKEAKTMAKRLLEEYK